jgi:hypothetical protein
MRAGYGVRPLPRRAKGSASNTFLVFENRRFSSGCAAGYLEVEENRWLSRIEMECPPTSEYRVPSGRKLNQEACGPAMQFLLKESWQKFIKSV